MPKTGPLQPRGLLRKDKRKAGKQVFASENDHPSLAHGLCHFRHFASDSPVRFMLYSPATKAFISLQTDNTVSLFKSKCRKKTHVRKQTLVEKLPFLGLTATKILGWIIGWGPGPIFSLLDSDLQLLDTADDALDICLCEPAEHSWELVTVGRANVCVWSVLLMRCKVKIQEGLQQNRNFSHLALAPPQKDRPHIAFVSWEKVVTVVDLDGGTVMDHKEDLCPSDITAMLFCVQLDCLIIASKDRSITVWTPDWIPCVTFFGHDDVVNSLFYCSKSNLLISCSADCTIRSWDVEKSMALESFHMEQKSPPLGLGGMRNRHPFFSFSARGADLWFLTPWHTLHSKLREDEGIPLKQIRVLHCTPSYPTRVVCVSEDHHISLLSAGTATVLTSFKPEKRILCADYCLHQELLLVLTEEGTVLQANTLSNPATLLQEWEGIAQGPWQSVDGVTKRVAKHLPVPGPAICMVLYSSVADSQRALEGWRCLQEERGCCQRSQRYVDHFKNKFWIIIGQSGGCVSVLAVDDGNVLRRIPAHNGQSVTAMQVHLEYNCLLTSGEDFTVVVWRVHPDAAACLTQKQIVECGQLQFYLAASEHQLALTCQKPESGSFSPMLFNLESQELVDSQTKNAHLEPLTGVCVIPGLEAFVSSSLDKTVRIWNEKNQLIWMQKLMAVPQCIAYSGNGELFLGMKGDLYRIEFAQLLPKKYEQKLKYKYIGDHPLDLPIPENKRTQEETDASNCKAEKLQKAIDQNQVMSVEVQQDEERLSLIDLDLKALINRTVSCTKRKPQSTKQTKKRAFDCYMHKLYGFKPTEKIGPEDDFEDILFNSKIPFMRKRCFPKLKAETVPQPRPEIPVNIQKEKILKPQETKKSPVTVRKKIHAPVQEVVLTKVKLEKVKETEEIIMPEEKIQPRLRIPPPKIQTALPQQEPSPELPTFLNKFAQMEWFDDLYPDKKSISINLSPKDLSLQLLSYLQDSSSTTSTKILAAVQALQALQSQNLLNNTDELFKGLTDTWEKFIRSEMTHLDRSVILEMLNLLVELNSAVSSDLVNKLLALLAYKQLNLRIPLFRLLGVLGVNQAQIWLSPELERWESEVESQSNKWERLHDKADSWMKLWISKFKDYNRYLYLRSSEKWKPPSFSGVDILNFFCLLQKEEHKKICFVPPAGQKYQVLLPKQNCCFKPILRLGEMYTLARKRKLKGVFLPPPQKRPYLSRFPRCISLPLPRVHLRPFHANSYERLVRLPTPSYFIPQQSTVEYYRREPNDERLINPTSK